jgi:hypothetical protein
MMSQLTHPEPFTEWTPPSSTARDGRWVIVDIDGTVADNTENLHLITQEPKDWNTWYANVGQAKPIEPVVKLVRLLSETHRIAMLTARSDECRLETVVWLREHRVPYSALLMRREGDHRPDVLVKAQLYKAHFDPGQVWFALEDRTRVVEMWRSLGVPCFQVTNGDY